MLKNLLQKIKKRTDLVNSKNEAESTINLTEKAISDLGTKINAEEKSRAESEMSELKKAIQADDIEKINQAHDILKKNSSYFS